MSDPKTPIIGAHIHGPATKRENAQIILDLAITSEITRSPIIGNAIINDVITNYMLDGLTYTNIHTEQWPAGEIRGQNTIKEIRDNFVKFRTILRGSNEIPAVSASFQGEGEYVLNVQDGSISWNIKYGDTQVESGQQGFPTEESPQLVPEPLDVRSF